MFSETEIPPEQTAAGQTGDMPADPALRGGMRDTLTIALPMVLSMSFDTFMTFVDRLFLSKLGPHFMNAALAGGMGNFMLMTVFMGLIGYVTAMVAQRMGAGNSYSAGRVVLHGLFLVCIAYPLILLLRPVVLTMFTAANLDPAQLAAQQEYFSILVYGSCGPLARHTLSSFFSGIGRTRIIMFSSLAGMLVNITLNWLLIFGNCGLPAMGISGAAIGTITGSGVALLILFIEYFKKSIRIKFGTTVKPGFERAIMNELLKKGSPAGVEMLLNLTAFQVMILLFHGKGAVSATASTIMFNWDMVSYVPLIGLEIAATSLVGRYVGARDFTAVKRSARSGIIAGWVFSIAVLAAFMLIPEVLVNMFRPDSADAVFTEAFPLAVFMIRVASVYILIEAIMVVYAGALRGAGDTFITMIIMVSLHWLLVLLLWLMLYRLNLGIQAAWVGMVAVFMFFPLLLWLRWKSEAWKDKIKMPQQ